MTCFKGKVTEWNYTLLFLNCLIFLILIIDFICLEVNYVVSKKFAVGILCIILLIKFFLDSFVLKKSSNDNLHLSQLINNLPMLSYVLSPKGKFLFGNARAREIFEYGKDITSDGEVVEFSPDMIMNNVLKALDKVLKTGECYLEEKPFLLKNGEYSWYRVQKIPLKDENNKIYSVICFSINIDAEKRIQEQRETYIATLSHDLKTPALAQVRALELLLSGQMGEFNESQKEMLKLTLDSCNYMYDMVYTLLSTCKFESNEVCLNYSEIDMVALINESINEISNLANENSINIDFNPNSGEYVIMADRIEIKRVVINLLSNAINYAYQNSIVKVLIDKENDKFIFRVINSSPYIEPEVMSGLFRKYVTHSEKYNKVGIGLGLYLSKKIIEAHNGEIIAHSSKRQSNTFGFALPVSNLTKVSECAVGECSVS